jgi:HSP20 family protein
MARGTSKKKVEPAAQSKERAPQAKESVPKAGEERRVPALRPSTWDPALLSGSPFAVLRRFTEEMDRLFDDFRVGFPRLRGPLEGWGAGEAAWSPSVEVMERGGKLVIRADLPGLTKKDVKVEIRDDTVCIQGERRQERESKGKGFYRSERSYGSFYREVPLPEGADPEKGTATFKDGVLEVTVPAPPQPAKGRRVPIED